MVNSQVEDEVSTRKRQPNPAVIFETLNRYQHTMALNRAIDLELFTHIGDGATLDHEGNYQEAETLERAAVAVQLRVLGPEHPSTLIAMNNLAETPRLSFEVFAVETQDFQSWFPMLVSVPRGFLNRVGGDRERLWRTLVSCFKPGSRY